MELLNNPVFRAYLVSTTLLGMNLLVLANNTAVTRGRHKEMVNPEDGRINKGATVVYDGGNDVTARYRRAHRNALENIPLFLITGLLLPIVGAPLSLAAPLYAIFVVARIVHSVAYVGQLQPWRTLSFGVGALDQLVLLGALAWFALGGG